VYDAMGSVAYLPFEDRSKFLHEIHKTFLISTPIVPVQTHLVHDEDQLNDAYVTWIESNYEGQMIRLNEPYEYKRSNTLLKRKEFEDAEYEITFVGEGKGNKTGTAAYMTLRREDGVEFSSNIKGTDEHRTRLLADSESLIGKYAIVKYFNLTPDGIPRFPFVIGIRDGVGID